MARIAVLSKYFVSSQKVVAMEGNMLDIAVPGRCCGLASPGHSVGCRIHIQFEVEN